MSHITTGEIRIKDLDALEQAVRGMGGELVRDQRNFKWFGKFLNDSKSARDAIAEGHKAAEFGKCEHAIRIPGHEDGDYEVGVVRHPDGKGWTTLFDAWGKKGRRVMEHYGPKCSKLRTEYGIAVVRRASRGRRVEVIRKGERVRVRVHA